MVTRNVEDMNDRKCIVTGKSGDADMMIRFVAGPDDQVVPDLKKSLPGRGCWVSCGRSYIEEAVRKNLFSRGLKHKVSADPELASLVDALLAKAALGGIGMARKAGRAIAGSAQVDKAVRAGRASAVFHALEAQPDGVRKIDQARRATVHLDGPDIPAFHLFSGVEMDLAFGGGNVIHAALLDGGPANAALRRVRQLNEYRQVPGNNDSGAKSAVKETDEE